jgi:diguanylate cyclase (GGDEF)-like protein
MTSFETILRRYFKFLESKGKTFNIILTIAWTTLFGVLDIITPSETSFSFLYLLPIAFVTWFAGLRAGLVFSFVCTTFWSIHNPVGKSFILAWNIFSTIAIFCTVSVMLSKIQKMWMNDKALSRIDPLTGVMNIRAFYELIEYEMLRHQRESSPFSIAYLDLDNFKIVNDQYGHKKGDDLLKAVVVNLVESLRKTDVIARAGGDEFVIFLPSTGQDTIQIVMKKVREQLNKLSESKQWVITFSMGVVTCTHNDSELEKIISIADSLMYEVKNTTKNDIRFETLLSNG